MGILKEKINWYNDKTEESRVLAWWSGGVASAIACKIALETYKNVFVAFCDTGIEHPDTYRFMADFEKALGVKVHKFKSDRFSEPEDVWFSNNYLNTAGGAPCSSRLKADVRIKQVQDLDNDYCQIFGFDYCSKEINRANNMSKNHPELNPKYPLIDNKITREGLFREISKLGIEPPITYKHFLNNNCIGAEDSEKGGCIQGGIGYWKKIKDLYPLKFERMARNEVILTDRKIDRYIKKSINDYFWFDETRMIYGEVILNGTEGHWEVKKFRPISVLRNGKKGRDGEALLLKPNDKFPHLQDISQANGVTPVSHFECNGFCSTNDAGQETVMFQQELF